MMQEPVTPEPLWTLTELAERVEEALSVDYAGPANGQIRAVPNARALRYYTTLGLLDRPAEMRGRTAYYGRRHLLQVVTIKRLQAQGLPLEKIQARLLGLTDTKLEDLAHLPELPALKTAGPAALEAATESVAFAADKAQARDRREEPFWAAEPAPLQEPAEYARATVAALLGRDEETEHPTAPRAAEASPEAVQGMLVADGVTLVLTGKRKLSDEDLSALRRAARALQDELRLRGLAREEETQDDSAHADDATPGHGRG
ncbi:MAG: helix-turn-helix domain-containing protein [Planctomycetota bacterium]|nr:helix-turn-helix domain-containing protein [Planctomycetota bacterium]